MRPHLQSHFVQQTNEFISHIFTFEVQMMEYVSEDWRILCIRLLPFGSAHIQFSVLY